MGFFGKNIIGVIVEREVEAVKRLIGIFMPEPTFSGKAKRARFGDVIGVNRGLYQHYGIYINKRKVIHYASPKSNIRSDACIHKTTLKGFLRDSTSYFVCRFPEKYGKPEKLGVEKAYKLPRLPVFYKNPKYKLYSPRETVRRAKTKVGENKYNLVTNNCEHFAIWCKTGVSESHQVNTILELIIGLPIMIRLPAAK